MKYYIINVEGNNKKNKGRRHFLVAEITDEMRFQKVMALTEDVLLNMLVTVKGAELGNATLAPNRSSILENMGDFTRFDDSRLMATWVIVSEIKRHLGNEIKTIGYKVLTQKGELKVYRLEDVLKRAEEVVNLKKFPFQNGIYVPAKDGKSAYIKSYVAEGFPVEYIEPAEVRVSQTEVAKAAEKRTAKEVVENLFNKEQLVQLGKGKEAGVDIRLYANPELDAEHMRVLREAMEAGYDVRLLANPRLGLDEVKFYVYVASCGVAIEMVYDEKFDKFQLSELFLGILHGVDISAYANPDFTVQRMVDKRQNLEFELWDDMQKIGQ